MAARRTPLALMGMFLLAALLAISAIAAQPSPPPRIY
jgi:hypothetical protein